MLAASAASTMAWEDHVMEVCTLRIGETARLRLSQGERERWQFVVMGSGIEARRAASAQSEGIVQWELEAVAAGRVLIAAILRDATGAVHETRNYLYRIEEPLQPNLVAT